MDLVIFLAKIIATILPFLNRKSKIKGKWRIEYSSPITGDRFRELVEFNQLSSLVWGKINPVDNPNDSGWQCFGLIRDQVFVGIYLTQERLRHWQGSFTLTFGDNFETLTGYYSGFEEASQTIINSSFKMNKL